MGGTRSTLEHAAAAERSSPGISLHLPREQLAVVQVGIAEGSIAPNPVGKLVHSSDVAARLVGYPFASRYNGASSYV